MGTILKHRGEAITLATALTVAQVRGIPRWANLVDIHVPSATLENISVGFGPAIQKVWFYDASDALYTDLTANLTDRNTSTSSGTTMNAMTSSDFLYVGSHRRYAGWAVDVGSANALASTATVTYWNGSAWTNITATDGTQSGGDTTLAVDGNITWTVPTDWTARSVNSETADYFWTRLAVSATLTNPTSINELALLVNQVVNSANTDAEGWAYITIRSNNNTMEPTRIPIFRNDIGAIQMISASITSAANVNYYEVTR